MLRNASMSGCSTANSMAPTPMATEENGNSSTSARSAANAKRICGGDWVNLHRSLKGSAIVKRLDILERLLSSEATLHPPACNCAIKSRNEANHLPECPYRQIKELVRLLKESRG
jgi:hypothetical protein